MLYCVHTSYLLLCASQPDYVQIASVPHVLTFGSQTGPKGCATRVSLRVCSEQLSMDGPDGQSTLLISVSV